jgi:Domain of unknown function (DUF1844)
LPKEQEIMSDTTSPGAAGVPTAGADAHSQHFNNMVMQIANTALTFLGAVPHPETGQHIQDLDMARLLIDQLAMLEVKTKGNLNAPHRLAPPSRQKLRRSHPIPSHPPPRMNERSLPRSIESVRAAQTLKQS